MYQNNPAITHLAGEALEAYRLVQQDGTYADDDVTHDAIGATMEPIANAERGRVRLPTAGTLLLEAAGTIAEDARVYQDDDGKVKALPASGETNHICRGVNASGGAAAAGDIIAVNPTGWGRVDTAPA